MSYDPANEQRWMARRKCTQSESELFFIDAPRGSTKPTEFVRNAEAKSICNGKGANDKGCPVKTECLTFALVNNEQWGVWGGLDEREREALTKGGAA